MKKTIFLVDMNAFFISCEEQADSSLRPQNAAVAGDPQKRTGIILTANYNARKYGVRTAMTVSDAKSSALIWSLSNLTINFIRMYLRG
jgi:DNA polymerase IV